MKRREFCKNATISGVAAVSSLSTTASFATTTRDKPSANDQITALSASRLSAVIRDREISCNEVMEAYLERIHRYNRTYNAIVSLASDDTLLGQAEEADKALAKGT